MAPYVLGRGTVCLTWEAQSHTHHFHRTHTYSTSSGFLLCRPDLLRPCPTTTLQLHHHNGPVCKCEKLMSHHKNSVSPLWNLEQYLFSCSQRAAPHHPGTECFQMRRHSVAVCWSWNETWRSGFCNFFFFVNKVSVKKLSQSYSLCEMLKFGSSVTDFVFSLNSNVDIYYLLSAWTQSHWQLSIMCGQVQGGLGMHQYGLQLSDWNAVYDTVWNWRKLRLVTKMGNNQLQWSLTLFF